MGRLVFLVLGFSCFLNSQNSFVGKTIDENNLPLEDVLVLIKDSLNGKILKHSYTNKLGEFFIDIDKLNSEKNIIINFNLIGYTPKSYKLHEVLNISTIILSISTSQLNEVIIESKSFIKKKDTIVYYANRYKDGAEDTVEDLLKKIPGLNIESDGTIKIGDKEVERVMVDGDDFFEKGYKILTKSMPANSVNTIELIDKYTKNKLLKNIENSSKVALNLTLNNDFKGKWFGSFLVGISNRPLKNYELKSNAMNFKKKNKYYFLTSVNSIGIESISDYKKLNQTSNDLDVLTNNSIENIISINIEKPFHIKQERYTFNNSNLFSLNSIHSFKFFKVKFNGYYIRDKLNYEINKSENFNLNEAGIRNDLKINSNLINSDFLTSVNLESDFKNNINIQSNINFISRNSNFNNSQNFNGINISEDNSTPENLFNFKNNITYKIDSLCAVLVNFHSSYETLNNDYYIKPVLYLGLFENVRNILNQKTVQNSIKNSIFIKFYKKNKNKSLFEASILYNNISQNLKTTLILDNNTNNFFKNHINLYLNQIITNFKYDFRLKKMAITPNLTFEFNKNEWYNNDVFKDLQTLFMKPSININYQINHKNNLGFNYDYNVFFNSINNLNENHINNSFRNFQVNSNELMELNESSFRLTHLKVDYDSKIFFTNIISFINSHDYLSNNSIISQDVFINQNYLVKNKKFLTLISNIDYYYKKISSTLKISNGFNFLNFENIVNNQNRFIENKTFFSSLSFRSNFIGNFNFVTETRLEHSRINVNIDLNKIFNYNLKLNFNYKIGKNKFIFLKNEIQQIYSQKTWQESIIFTDLNFRYHFNNKKSIIYFNVSNIFDANFFKFINNTDVGVFENNYRLQPRLFMVKYELRF